jgi:hypothetical protein
MEMASDVGRVCRGPLGGAPPFVDGPGHTGDPGPGGDGRGTGTGVTVSAGPAITASTGHRIREWILRHDDRWSFTIAYVGGAVVLSIWIGLFWLGVVMAVHALLEWVRQRAADPALPGVLGRVAWEMKLDAALFLFALALAVYMDVVLGAAGLGGASRMAAHAASRGLRGGARMAGWVRTLRGVLLSLDDAALLAKAAVRGRDGEEGACDEDGEAEAVPLRPWRSWGTGDHIGVWMGVAFLVSILAAPWLLPDGSVAGVWQTMLAELHPLGHRE